MLTSFFEKLTSKTMIECFPMWNINESKKTNTPINVYLLFPESLSHDNVTSGFICKQHCCHHTLELPKVFHIIFFNIKYKRLYINSIKIKY